MDGQSDNTKVKDLISGAKEILIATHERPTFDSIGSSLALGLGLSSLGKKVTVVCPDPMTVELSSFIGVNKIESVMGKKNFVISLDYVEGSIEKVSYNIAGNTFNLVIEPRPGFPPFNQEKVHYSHAGATGDLIITVDTIHLGGLKRLYEDNKEFFASKSIINIDRHPNNSHFGAVNLVNNQASSTAELVGDLLNAMGVGMSEDMGTNLLNALYAGTNNFQSQYVTAPAFDLASHCLKAGGKRFRTGEAGKEAPISFDAPVVKPEPAAAQTTQPAQAPADWLKPKIFKSSNTL